MSAPSLRTPFAVALFLLAAAMAGSAHAAEKARPGASPASDRILTPAQLRDCLAHKDELRAQTDTALKAKADLAAEKAEIDRTASAIGDELATLDRTSADAVAAHNAKVDQRDSLIEGYQTRVTAFNGRAEAVQAARGAYEKSCENRRYDDRDLIPLQRKK